MTEALARRLSGADLVFFDGTLWTDGEMIRAGLGDLHAPAVRYLRAHGRLD